MKRFIIFFILLIAVSLLILYVSIRNLQQYAHTPLAPQTKTVTIRIETGANLTDIIRQLNRNGITVSEKKFRIIARYLEYDRRIHTGEYQISGSITPLQLLKQLSDGKVKLYRLTIPEGFSIDQIAKRVSELPFHISQTDFINATQDKNWLDRLQIPSGSLEGYLFPDTYYFPKSTDSDAIIKSMIQRFETVFSTKWTERAKILGLSRHQVVTLASIIEKETGVPDERPMISSVFHNRLKRKMRLESDPTVIYGIHDYDGNITRKHLKTYTPYNTYRISGLPPGPIASPGAAALEAALYPLETDYLFFVSKKDSTHFFSKTLSEHKRAVRKYQLRRK